MKDKVCEKQIIKSKALLSIISIVNSNGMKSRMAATRRINFEYNTLEIVFECNFVSFGCWEIVLSAGVSNPNWTKLTKYTEMENAKMYKP